MNAANPLKDIYEDEVRGYIAELLDHLPPRHRVVIRLRYGMEDGREHTLESIGNRLKISRERVRQIQSEAIERIARIASEQDPSAPVAIRGLETSAGPAPRYRKPSQEKSRRRRAASRN